VPVSGFVKRNKFTPGTPGVKSSKSWVKNAFPMTSFSMKIQQILNKFVIFVMPKIGINK
jgi:hypothetical protein